MGGFSLLNTPSFDVHPPPSFIFFYPFVGFFLFVGGPKDSAAPKHLLGVYFVFLWFVALDIIALSQ